MSMHTLFSPNNVLKLIAVASLVNCGQEPAVQDLAPQTQQSDLSVGPVVTIDPTLANVARYFIDGGCKARDSDQTYPGTCWRWVATLDDKFAGCPKIGGWQDPHRSGPNGCRIVYSFTTTNTPSDDGCDHPMEKGFCMYETSTTMNPTLESADKIDALYAHLDRGTFVALGPDHLAVLPALDVDPANTASLGAATWEKMRSHFLAQAGYWNPGERTNDNTYLTIFDTAPDCDSNCSIKATGVSEHGNSILNIARGFLCFGNQPCLAEPQSRLALRYRAVDNHSKAKSHPVASDAPAAPGASDPGGGYVGSVWDLGDEIRREHKKHLDDSHLWVVNLSVGWKRLHSLTNRLPDEDSVYMAIRSVARQRNKLVIAAAGNRMSKDQPGPLFPARWDSKSAFANVDGELVQPLYAIGAVGTRGAQLANGIEGGEPKMVTYGSHAVVYMAGTNGQEPTAVLTGTSVSAVLVSTMATAIWARTGSYYSSTRLMEGIYATGDDLIRPADFARPCGANETGGVCGSPNVRRLTFCEAVSHMDFQLYSMSVADNDPCPNWDKNPPNFTIITAGFLKPTASKLPAGAKPPGKKFEDANATPWVLPQPTPDSCPSCVIVLGNPTLDTPDLALLQFALPTSRAQEYLNSPTLTVTYSDNVTTYNLAINVDMQALRDSGATYSDAMRIVLPSRPAESVEPTAAAVSFAISDPAADTTDTTRTRSTVSSLLVTR